MTHVLPGEVHPLSDFPPVPAVRITHLSERSVTEIWRRDHDDRQWLLPDRSESAWRAFVCQQQAAEVLGLAAIRAVRVERALSGYVTMRVAWETQLAPSETVVECGTYLLSQCRGQGWNAPVKKALLDVVWRGVALQTTPTWCVFVVPTHHAQALQALRKIALPWVVESSEQDGVFSALLRRKAWETGQPCVVFAVRRPS